MRTLLLIVALIGLIVSAGLTNYAVDRALAQSNASYELDRFGNPWHPNYRQANVRISRLERARALLVWAGILPVDTLAIASALLDLRRRRGRWLAAIALAIALLAAGLLVSAALASTMPGPALVG